uniref:Uncharacterized protein n=1 Tax=Amphimedon queenslandica TaxID=400682 RepID=A0A1X7VPZ0_AMPQE
YINSDSSFSYNSDTDLPMVGITVTTSPNLSLYSIVVFPAASKPTMSSLTSFCPNHFLIKEFPILIKLI